MTVHDIAVLIDGEIIGDSNIPVFSICPLNEPSEGAIVYIEKEKNIHKIINSPVSAILLPHNIPTPHTTKPIIKVNDHKLAFIKLLNYFDNIFNFSKTIHTSCSINDSSSIGQDVCIMENTIIQDHVIIDDNVTIYPNCFIGSYVQIKQGTIIYPNSTIYKGTIIGENNIIHSGAVIGSDGFGYHDSEGIRYKIPHIGIVETEEDVEIGANTAIDRATIGKTFIGKGTKIDNLVQIAHNCKIGEYCYIAGQVGIAGSVTLGNRVQIAGQVGISDHVHIGDDVSIYANTTVTQNIPQGQTVMGFPAKPISQARRIYVSLSKLPDILKKITKSSIIT